MSDIAIRVDNLGKRYRIGAKQERYSRFTEKVMDTLTSPIRRLRHLGQPTPPEETLWALKDVSFEVKRGEALGIIGRNGSGKSTLLKVLSRITEPTEGHAEIHGRVASLLEVGTGFHPELTGRENIYLNGAILGMRRGEIERRFDEIVAFAEIEKFLDTPVKRYSSGMYVRLAFAVAAHLDPDILLVDEVLAVGDTEFQKKCLGKMGDVAREGRTVLFVSHNMAAVRQLCLKGLLLNQGRVQSIGDVDLVQRDYLASTEAQTEYVDLSHYSHRSGTQQVSFEWALLQDRNQRSCRIFSIGDDITLVFCMRTGDPGRSVRTSVELRASDGLRLSNMIDVDSRFRVSFFSEKVVLSVCIKDVRLYPDTYFISLYVGDATSIETYDRVEDCCSFIIEDGGKLTTRRLPRSGGLLFLTPDWRYVNDCENPSYG